MIMPAGAEDGEHPDAGHESPPQRIQSTITRMMDEFISNGLRQFLEDAKRHCDITRIGELSSPNVNHGWLWVTAAWSYIGRCRLCGGGEDTLGLWRSHGCHRLCPVW